MTTDVQALEGLASLLGPIMERQKAMRYGVKHDLTAASPITVGYSHGPGGRFTFPGVDPDVFSAAMGIVSMFDQLPAMPSLYTDPTYYIVTGVTDESGSEKTNVCDDAPVAGLMKACLHHAVFGRYERQTAQLELNRLGQRNDRADPLDLRLINSPVASMGIWGNGSFDPENPADVFANEVSRKFWERNVAFQRLLATQLWVGNPSHNSAGGGYKELTGFDLLINTGHVDAETNVACAAADSYVRNLNHGRVDAASTNIVAEMTNMAHQLKFRAERMRMNPVRWVIAMRHSLFYEITALWPCAYLSYRCATAPGMASPMQGVIDAQDAVRMRDEMRAGNYLLIDGERWEVVVDDGILELDGNSSGGNFVAGCFESNIYFIPMSVVGGRAVTYLEYFQYQNPSIQEAFNNMVLGVIEGPFLTWPKQTNQCVQWQSKTEPRLVMRTPQLAGKLQNIVYCPIEHEREPFPDDPYFVNGGGTSRPGPSLYDPWEN